MTAFPHHPGALHFITFLSDFGYEAESVAICKGVLKRLAPQAEVLDVCHGIPSFDVQAGALALENAVPYLPKAVHLAVVDPGVGGPRRAVALQVQRGDYLVGPDNGLLAPAAAALGGVVRACRLENPALQLQPLSATFHGRDIFAPAAAFLASGGNMAELGGEVSPADLAGPLWPPPQAGPGWVRGTLIGFDQFGSARLNIRPQELQRAGVLKGAAFPGPVRKGPLIRIRGPLDAVVPFVYTYSQVPAGSLCLLTDSDGRLSLAVNQGSARRAFGLARGRSIILEAVQEQPSGSGGPHDRS
ncbi:MAG: SAM-dependent chlorinase/fluorinase [Firmicutes bacterium]|nr:SAM-dependent chlorinase/fluorinase [Bacillota bacterium]